MLFKPKTKIGRIFITNIDISKNEKLTAQFAAIWKSLDEYESSDD